MMNDIKLEAMEIKLAMLENRIKQLEALIVSTTTPTAEVTVDELANQAFEELTNAAIRKGKRLYAVTLSTTFATPETAIRQAVKDSDKNKLRQIIADLKSIN